VLFSFGSASAVWLYVMVAGFMWLDAHVSSAFGVLWFVGLLLIYGLMWRFWLRYLFYLIECGHVAVITELITHNCIEAGSESMFAYGRRVVMQRFAEANVLFGLQTLVRGVLRSFHRTLEWMEDLLPLPGIDIIMRLISAALSAATLYLDKAIFSYDIA
jgi:hypothetical protein